MEVIIEQKNVAKNEKQVEVIILITSKESLETDKLHEMAIKKCNNVIIIKTLDDLYINYIKRFKKVGVIIDHLAPKNLVNKVIEILKNTETEDYMYEYER